jgi:hypothetical protein
VIINVGCAEGYCAVGMARLLPPGRIYAFDINPQAQDICASTRNISLRYDRRHDSLNPLITQIRKQRFSASYDIENISEGPRDPNRFASLRLWESLDRWLAIDEGRPSAMNWLV